MGGQVLGGGVIVLVAVLLWLVYLLPSWHSRHQYNAAERNAVRLNQAIRILAETSDTPEEVRLELSARTALAQQRLARRAAAEREQAELEGARAALETARAERAAAHALPAARRARARRRARLTVTVFAVASLALAGWGAWQLFATGAQTALWWGGGVAVVCVVLLQRMSRVAARGVSAPPVTVVSSRTVGHPALAPEIDDDRTWTPRALPGPLASAPGSRAAVELDSAQAQQELRDAARREAMRERAARLRPAPPDIAAARATRSENAFAGPADDESIEAHVRRLLAERAAG
jgi:hypothetical protein